MNSQKFKANAQVAMNKFTEVGGKISNQRHFAAIRDGFGALLPVTIVGSIGLMIAAVFLDPNGLLAFIFYGDAYAPAGGVWSDINFYLSPFFAGVNTATIGYFALYISFMLGYYLAGSYGDNKLYGGIMGLVGYFLLQPASANPDNAQAFFGATGIIFAMIAGLAVPTILHHVQTKFDLTIRMPDGVPPAITNAFALLIPLAITMFAWGAIQPLWGAIMYAAGPGKTVTTSNSIFLTISGVQFNLENPFTGETGDWLNYDGVLTVTISEGDSVTGQLYSILAGGKYASMDDVTNAFGEFATAAQNQLIAAILSQNSAWNAINLDHAMTFDVTGLNTIQVLTSESINVDWYYFINGLNTILVAPLQGASQQLWFIWIYLMFMTTLFFFGIHGPNTLSAISSLYTAASLQNVELYAQLGQTAYESGNLWSFNDQIQTYFGTMGGTGATIGLMFAVAFFSKTPKTKQINNLAFGPGCFNINEPIIFGFPLMLNFVYAIPFIFIMPIDGVIGTWLINIGFVKPSVFLIPWTTPAPLGAFLVTMDWKAAVVSIGLIIITFFGYLPFVLLDAKSQAKADLIQGGDEQFNKLSSRKDEILGLQIEGNDDEAIDDELKIIEIQLKGLIDAKINQGELEVHVKAASKYHDKGTKFVKAYNELMHKKSELKIAGKNDQAKDLDSKIKEAKSKMKKAIKQYSNYQKPLNKLSALEERFENRELEMKEIIEMKSSELQFQIDSLAANDKKAKMQAKLDKFVSSANASIEKSRAKLENSRTKLTAKANAVEAKINI